MRWLSWNVNGVRAATRKGFIDWFEETKPDVLCLQETKARPDQVDAIVAEPPGYHAVWAPAVKPGYSGVATYSRQPPDEVVIGLGDARFDDEGRTIITRYGDVTLFNGYFPNSRRDLARVDFKTDFYRLLRIEADARRDRGEHVVICGDWNTAHRPIDLRNWKANQKASGFLPEERALIDEYVDAGYVDVFRHLNPELDGAYTWWSNRAGVRARNVGWRIDYHFVDDGFMSRVIDARIHAAVMGSDHCPIELEFR